MTLKDFIEKSDRHFQREGLKSIPDISKDFFTSAISKTPYVNRFGTNVYEKEWDVLVILDACRLDLYRETINGDADTIWSVGSSSEEWMQHTFGNADTTGTAYITGNIFSREYLDENHFYALEEVWEYGWDDDEGTIPPRPLTNEAVRTWRQETPERMIIHYMQPHFPAIGSDVNIGGKIEKAKFGDPGRDFWLEMRLGSISDKDAWRAYRDNLEYVFEEVELLMENVTGTVAITADHGNAFGEWGAYGHPAGYPIPQLRRVPWDVYDCTDERTFTTTEPEKYEATATEVEDRLYDLGYM
ncbi:hypothetical protein A4G99_06585 [Haladaptatus sp. R4]|uniref:hypothetical protein n=1 Tax=Haladaptatus sp. R4 TaxID=1679489 RepID=UPI0007B49A45|nr:hypothetical protein [Haladaptatus sp. R4]KZN24113.1 hypothetical protein A4G99_06585 [Haladaptatus sp. R4]